MTPPATADPPGSLSIPTPPYSVPCARCTEKMKQQMLALHLDPRCGARFPSFWFCSSRWLHWRPRLRPAETRACRPAAAAMDSYVLLSGTSGEQFATPPALSLDMARYAWNKLKRRKGAFSFLDPAIGTGSFFGAFRQVFPVDRIEGASGIELDKPFAEAANAIWHSQGLRVIQGDFTRQKPEPSYNVILTNPPSVRHHHLLAEEKVRLRRSAGCDGS